GSAQCGHPLARIRSLAGAVLSSAMEGNRQPFHQEGPAGRIARSAQPAGGAGRGIRAGRADFGRRLERTAAAMTSCTSAERRTESGALFHPLKGGPGLANGKAAACHDLWVLGDASGRVLSADELPRLADLEIDLRFGDLVLRAPGMMRLDIAVDVIE